MDKVTKMMSLLIGSPPPYPCDYQIGVIDALFNYTSEELEKEQKRGLELYKKHSKEYKIKRKKELEEFDKLLKED